MAYHVILVGLLSLCASTLLAQDQPDEPVADRQGQNGFNSVVDGQPATPGRPQFDLIGGSEFDGFGFLEAGLEFTPPGPSFARNMLLVAVAPRLLLGSHTSEFGNAISLGWQQRWIEEHNGWPTFSSEIMGSFGKHDPDFTGTLVLAKNAWGGVVYGNLVFESLQNGLSPPFTVLGYLHTIVQALRVLGSAAMIDGGIEMFELSFEYAAGNMTVGPGLALHIDVRPARASGGVFITFTP